MAKIRIMILSCFLFLFHCHKETQGEKNDRVFKENRPWLLYVMLRPYIYGDYCEGYLRHQSDETAVFGKEYIFPYRKYLYVNYPAKGIKITFRTLTSGCKMYAGYGYGCNFAQTYEILYGTCSGQVLTVEQGVYTCSIVDSRITTLMVMLEHDNVTGTGCQGSIKVENL